MEVRTRFAPSPTGYMHLGNLRTALYAYLVAKSSNGKFVVRIEDTDRERLVDGASNVIFDTLNATGLEADESPQKGGAFGPYIQSERKAIYAELIEQLIASGDAYYCFCTKKRLEAMRAEAGEGIAKYDRHCLHLSKEEIEANIKSGVPYVIRQKMPDTGSSSYHDAVFGDISVVHAELEDQVLMKSDGWPTYNFAHVVDDHLMQITHVVRGVEYLSSTPKYNLLYKALNWDIPIYMHLPPVMKNQQEKLSKRKGDASFEDLIQMGYLPEAVVNYIALLGWSPSDNTEIFTLEELVNSFSVSGISKSPSIFDLAKLKWMNSEYIKNMEFDCFYSLTGKQFENAVHLNEDARKKLASLVKSRLETLNDIPMLVDFIDNLPEYSIDLYVHKKMKTTPQIALDNLKQCLPVLEALPHWTEQAIHDTLIDFAKTNGIKNGQVLWPIRTALSGKATSPGGAIELAEILGKNETICRIKKGIEKIEEAI